MQSSDNYRAILLNDTPLIDTRAPIEFAKGSFPKAINLPLMSDSEREQVGTCYKQQGQEAAIALGHQLVSGAIKEERVKAWLDYIQQYPDAYIFCFRGGLRSQISQQWLKDTGVDCPRVKGGYKAMRGFLINTIEEAAQQCRFTVLGGLTGTGKTDILLQLPNSLDLEGHANHRGSSFGKHATAQPTQINFENALASDILKKRDKGISHFIIENESHLVGTCVVPLPLLALIKSTALVLLNDSFENRVERIVRDYVIKLEAEFVDLHGKEQGDRLFAQRLQQSLANISRRLGGERFQQLAAILDSALAAQLSAQGVDQHREWIAILLREYYDPMYNYQRQKNQDRIVFEGSHDAVVAYLQDSIKPIA